MICVQVCARRLGVVSLFGWAIAAQAANLRIVTYNIEADINGFTTARPGMETVLEGIGDESTFAPARPIDVLGLEETTSNTTTVAPMVTTLNAHYGAGVYAMSSYQGTENGNNPSTGNGPNALIYNTTTVQLIASVGVGTPSTAGAPRQPIRYQLRPVGGVAANDFYLYVSHMKSGTTTSDANRRNVEAQLLRTNEATLPATARVLYTGDFNADNTEAYFATLTAGGQGQAFDPLNVANWTTNTGGILTESATSLRYRDDLQFVTANVLNDANGLKIISGSHHTFGNNGSVAKNGTVTSGSNTALPGLPNRAAVISALGTASDHLPVVADYTIALSVPAQINLSASSFTHTIRRFDALADDSFTVSTPVSTTLNYTATSDSAWITPSPMSGTSTGEADLITLTYGVSTLPMGDYTAVITVSDPAATNTPQTIAVTLHVITPTGDFDHDNDTDLNDFAHLQACMTAGPPDAGCLDADMDGDGVIGNADIDLFTNCMAGSDVPSGC